jgi:hypothetical protein
MHDAHRGKGMEVQSPLPPLHSYRIPFQMATKVPINALTVDVDFQVTDNANLPGTQFKHLVRQQHFY